MARLFNSGSSQYIQVEAAPAIAPPFAMGCWFRADVIDVDHSPMSLCDSGSGNNYYRIRINTSEQITAQTRSPAGTQQANSAAVVVVGGTFHAVAVYAATDDRRIYVNGVQAGTNAVDLVPTGINRVAIGYLADSSPGNYFTGLVSEAFVVRGVPTDGQIARLARGISPLLAFRGSLAAYWPLIGPTMTGDNDFSPQHRFHLTAYNSPTWGVHPPNVRNNLLTPRRTLPIPWLAKWGEVGVTRIPRPPAAYNNLAIY